MKALLSTVAILGIVTAACYSAEPSANWSFDGSAEGLKSVGGESRFVDSATVPGVEGEALVLDGTSYLAVPITDATRLGASYTIEAWIHPTRLGEWNRIVLNWGTNKQYAYHFALHQGRASLLHCQADGNYIACEGGLVQPDRWQHIVGIADADTKHLRVYVDGKRVATVPVDGTAFATTNKSLAIGDSDNLSHPPFRFVGYLDRVTLWKHPLTDAQVAARYAAHPKSPPPPPVNLTAPGEIVFAERHPGVKGMHWYSNFGYACTDENDWLYGQDGGRLCRFDPKSGKVTVLLDDPRGSVRDPEVSYDATRILFSYRQGGTHHFNLYEMNADGSELRQLTSGDWDDIEPCYLPDGGIAFCSSRCQRYINCWYAPTAILFRCHADGTGIRQLSSGVDAENTPAVLPDGRILFMRWEYVNRDAVSFHHLWTMNPDGTGITSYYGNMYPGGVFIDARPIPGTGRVVYVDSGYHGTEEHAGRVFILDRHNGPDDRSQVRALTGDGFRDPYPISANEFLAARGNELVTVSAAGKVTSLWKSTMMVHEPRLIAPRPVEPVIASRVDPTKTTGTLFVQNVLIGRNLAGLQPGSIKKLLILEQLPKPVNFHGGGATPIAHGGAWTINRILGTVPVEADGSASLEVPAGRSLYLALLDERGLCAKQMRSFLTVQPGERASCIGCHENRNLIVPSGPPALAARRAPSTIEPIAGIPGILDFPRDIQPILDRHCVGCHTAAKLSGGVNLTGDRGPTYSLSYYNLMLFRQIKDTAGLHWKGERNIGGRPAGNDAPYEAFSGAAPLMKTIDGSHHGVRLSEHERTMIRCWLDVATPYAGTYAAFGTGQIGGWWRNNEPIREMADAWPSTAPARDAMQRRCAACHQNRMPCFVTDLIDTGDHHGDMEGWMRPVSRFSRHNIFNLTHPDHSLALMATLAKSAGGYAEGTLPSPEPVAPDLSEAPKPVTHPVVFADTNDPDYRKILIHIEVAGARLNDIKRFDMPGFQPRYEYLREMKRGAVLPGNFDLKNPPEVDPYVLDQQYWQQFWPKAAKPVARDK